MKKVLYALAATIGACAAFGASAAPAQAQDPVYVCPGDIVPTGVSQVDRCRYVPTDTECVAGRVCVTGVQENVDAAVAIAWGAVGTAIGKVNEVVGKVPDPICTPNLLSGPICVNY